MSDDDDITGRWFKQLLATLRENVAVVPKIWERLAATLVTRTYHQLRPTMICLGISG